MRTSKKEMILRTAIDYIGEYSLETLSYDSLAEATGLSKSGLIYHFPSRHALLLAWIHRCDSGVTAWENRKCPPELEESSLLRVLIHLPERHLTGAIITQPHSDVRIL